MKNAKAIALTGLWVLGCWLIVRYVMALLIAAGSCVIKNGDWVCREPAVSIFWIVVTVMVMVIWSLVLYLLFEGRRQ